MRENAIEKEFVKAVREAGGIAYKLTSQTANGLPDRLVLFFPAKTAFVELKLGFPVLCIDRVSQIQPAVDAILTWTPGTPFPEGIGAKVPDLEMTSLPDGYESRIDPVNPIGGSFL